MKDIKNKCLIGIAYHKSQDFYPSTPYVPIQVGAKIASYDLGIQKDSDGDNISYNNAYCCELSATFWLWKNTEADYKGLFHYRRFMTFENQSIIRKIPFIFIYYASKIFAPFVRGSRYSYECFHTKTIESSEIEHKLKKFQKDLYDDIEVHSNDIYCLKKIKHSTYRNCWQLEGSIGYLHLECAKKIIKEIAPNFYQYFLQSLRSGSFYSCNMIIAKNIFFDEYCDIMFSILEKYISSMNLGIPEGVKNMALLRDAGYLGEFITDAYIRMKKAQGIKIKYLNLIQVDTITEESQKKDNITNRILNLFKGDL